MALNTTKETCLVGVYAPRAHKGGLYRINTINTIDFAEVNITNGYLFYVDGLRFNSDHSKLYVCSGKDSLKVLTSSDNWKTATIIKDYDFSNNPDAIPPISSVTLIPNGDSDLVYVLAANGFNDTLPYSIKRIQ
jgi:hypothetical protein